MPDDELVALGEEIIELAAAWPGTGLDKVGEFARDLGTMLDDHERVFPGGKA